MKFCPRCGSILYPTEGELKCECGYREKPESKIKIVEKIVHKEIEVIEQDYIGDSELPIVCWNCGNKGVYFWMVQMRRADEPPTRFYKCKKCKKVWRSGK